MVEEEKTAAPAEDSAPQGQAGGEEAARDMELLLEDARSKADEHWNQCVRLQAELDNQRKRFERDLEQAHRFALEKFVGELLPVRDSLEMGLNAATGETVDPERLKEGTELTLRMMSTAMDKFGIREINPEGERFDPQYHEAMSMQERSDVEPNTVVSVVQKGYALNERLLRPAMVIVSRAGQNQQSHGVDERA
ncbi:MAG TPA: nucleotide exchange factor GrpE [Gammaproteobacteria bacterium]|nr:nucleotide exchange factor GrpE [Gammaproteobacteria bacterium]